MRKEVYTDATGVDPVNLEVYYDPAHAYDVDDMLASARAGLDYYQSHFSPYQFTQFRIMEFPRYRTFAQSFANTVPFSEGIGFITRVKKPTDVDLTYFVTAHELGHQWWGHQLIGGQVEGSNMMSETLAQYSAYMVMQHKYGKDYMHRVLQVTSWTSICADAPAKFGTSRRWRWCRARPTSGTRRAGRSCTRWPTISARTRSIWRCTTFSMQYRYANAHNQVDAADSAHGAGLAETRYPDTRLLVDALRAQTPPELQYLIDDGFNRIVLYDNKTISATSKQLPDGKYQVTLDVQARKVQADGNGVESPMPLD